MDEKGIGKADILGFSDGANIALLFALKNPGRVRRLILNGADLFPKGVKRSVQIPIIIGYGIVSFLSLFSKKAMIRLSHTQLIARSIPGSKLAILEGDHFIASKKWEAFNRSVDAFFTERK